MGIANAELVEIGRLLAESMDGRRNFAEVAAGRSILCICLFNSLGTWIRQYAIMFAPIAALVASKLQGLNPQLQDPSSNFLSFSSYHGVDCNECAPYFHIAVPVCFLAV